MELQEKTLHSETIYDGKILHIRRDTVLLPNGREAIREVADHPGGVCVLALDQDNNALLVSQFRYPYRQVLRELPAGKLERGEDPIWRPGGSCGRRPAPRRGPSSPWRAVPLSGLLRGGHPYVPGPDLDFGDMNLDEDEFLNLERIPFSDLVEQVLSGEVKDAKTIAAVLKAKLLLGL